jgi:FKBP-type peptidyl-prolyl cis-trans isomerase
MLPEGTKADIYIPSVWAYQNGILTFNIDLVNIDLTETQISKLNSDTLAIDAELEEFNIDAIKEPGGLRYVMTNEGIGEIPTLYSQVKVAFRGLLLSDSSEFVNQVIEPSTDFSSRVANYPNGVMIALQKMKKGGKATLFTPSGLASSKYGIIIPANKNIVFEIELLDVIN